MKEADQARQNSGNQRREEKRNQRTEDRNPPPFDPGWLDRLPKEDDAPYRPWWVIDDPWPKPSAPDS